MTPPNLPELDDSPCPASRPTSDTTVWWQGVAHPRHHCVQPTAPHPAHPHMCRCGTSWPQVGIVACVECGTIRPIDALVMDNVPGTVRAYRCRDSGRCVPLPRGTFPDGHERAESQSDGSGVATPTPRHGDPPSVRVASARGILDAVTHVIRQHRATEPDDRRAPWGTIMVGIARVRTELELVAVDLAMPPVFMREPGAPPAHGEVTDHG